ncbi:MAG: hypothetical protein ACOX9R_09160 [Armatimonadota bacterium]
MVFACALAVALAAAGGRAEAQRVAASFDADEVEFSFDRRLVTLRGDAHIFSQVVDDPSRYVRIEADLIEGDLSRGWFEMVGSIHIRTPQGAMRGEAAWYDARTAQYSLRRAGIMIPLGEGEPPAVTCGFAYAQEIATEDEIIYITKGRFTTCSRPNPHYSLRADRFRWNPETQEVVVYGGSVKLYGLEIPVLPKIPYSFAQNDTDLPSLWPFPTYTSRDGLRLGWSFNVGAPMGNPSTRVSLLWRQLRPLHASSWTHYQINENLGARLRLGLQEDVRQDIERIVPVDRFPELGLEGHWPLWGDGYRLETDLSAGHYLQRREGGLAPVSEDRLRLQARLVGNPAGVYEPGQTWWWIDASEALYGNGGHYAALGAAVGGAVKPADWLAVNAELRRWETGGATPFVWDDVDIRTELEANLRLNVTDAWQVRAGGRYDLEHGALRTWDAQLRRREHCLTWKVSYSDISDNFMIGVEVNGLFGNDEPPDDGCPEDGPAGYREVFGRHEEAVSPADDDAPAGRQFQTHSEADTASEAMETP